MSQPNADRFKSTLLQAEQSRDINPLISLFASDATLDSPAHDAPLSGREGATQFWQTYLDAFKTVKSTFTQSQAFGDMAVLEWSSAGTLPTGRPIEYRGVSIITFAGDKVKRFVTYYDSAQFVVQTAPETVPSGWTNDNGGD